MERIKRAMELARQERQRNERAANGSLRDEGAEVEMLNERAPAAQSGHDGFVATPVAAAPGAAAPNGAAPNGATAHAVTPPSQMLALSEGTLKFSKLLLPGMVGEAAHGFRILRTQVLQRMRKRGWNSLAILSPGPDDGKTFNAINLAMAIAADANASALLIDLDLREPRIHRRLGFQPEVGVDDVMRGEAELEQALVGIEGYPGLTVLPARKSVGHSSELITNSRAQRLFRRLKEEDPNRIVIFDLPPVLATDDALAFSPQVDAALVIVGDGSTRRDDLLRCIELLRDTPILGTVLNGSHDERSAAYAY